jgi:hypothetical protein
MKLKYNMFRNSLAENERIAVQALLMMSKTWQSHVPEFTATQSRTKWRTPSWWTGCCLNRLWILLKLPAQILV